MNQSEIFKAAHKLANEMEQHHYSYRFSEALRIIYNSQRIMKNAKNTLSNAEKELIISSNGRLQIETIGANKITNIQLINKLSKYSYKSWKFFGGFQFMFSQELIQAIR